MGISEDCADETRTTPTAIGISRPISSASADASSTSLALPDALAPPPRRHAAATADVARRPARLRRRGAQALVVARPRRARPGRAGAALVQCARRDLPRRGDGRRGVRRQPDGGVEPEGPAGSQHHARGELHRQHAELPRGGRGRTDIPALQHLVLVQRGGRDAGVGPRVHRAGLRFCRGGGARAAPSSSTASRARTAPARRAFFV